MIHKQIQDKLKTHEILADLGVQTVYSSTGFSTLNEVINIAAQRGLSYIAITDYIDCSESNGDALIKQKAHLMSLNRIKDPRITVVSGAEIGFNKVAVHNSAGLPDVKWLIASDYSYTKRVFEVIKRSVESAVRLGIRAIGHPEQGLQYMVEGNQEQLTTQMRDYLDWLVDFCKLEKVYLGISELSARVESLNTIQSYWMNYAATNGNWVYLSSDARCCIDVGDFEKTTELVNDVGITKNHILNCDAERLQKMFGGSYA